MARTLVAVGIVSEASMFATTRPATPRRIAISSGADPSDGAVADFGSAESVKGRSGFRTAGAAARAGGFGCGCEPALGALLT